MEELNEKKTKYFVIAIIILIFLGVLLIVHFNNKQMVKGEDSKSDTPTTTEKVTTTTKKRVKIEEIKEEVVYKSVIDKDNKLVYNYKLTDEITETDILISKKLEISETLKEKDVIGLFDISLYDMNFVKKDVSNSLITIKIPLTEELKSYENYRVVYINEKNEITDEKFEVKVDTDYLEFNTTHLSVFGIIGTKKVVEEEVIDLSGVTVDVKVNDEVVENFNNILLEKDDKVELIVNNICDNCSVFYGLRPIGMNDFEYKKYEGTIKLEDGVNYKLFVKVSYAENDKTFELSNIGLYDEVFEYDKNAVLEDNVVIGKIESEEESSYNYDDKNKNFDIVIDNVTEEETNTVSNATISVNGNMYLVEETDISKLQMTGYLYIDTSENITYEKDQNGINLDGLYSLIIRSKEFMLNGDKYRYEYTTDGDLIIYLVEKAKAELEQSGKEMNSDETNNDTSNEETNNIPTDDVNNESLNQDKNIVYNSHEGNDELNNAFNEIFAGNYGVIVDKNNNKDLIIGIINTSNQATISTISGDKDTKLTTLNEDPKVEV